MTILNIVKLSGLILCCAAILAASACGKNGEISSNAKKQPAPPSQTQTEPEEPILVIVDQTKYPGQPEQHFYFQVEQIPKGYSLAEMRWKSDKTTVINTTEQAIEHGANGEDGFYISGNGQFSGFIYDEKRKGETGEVTFVFRNDSGKERTWTTKLTLQ
ncbi:hypothetical protein HMI46_23660 [Paenibacillus alvei]|uniref:Lipoprotein n=1 Tax=Paenibacillus alvei TaxID=44250 RepID=A0AAP7DL84_PAEAL|nr:hypothetical protein [Paenibacillus alvei]